MARILLRSFQEQPWDLFCEGRAGPAARGSLMPTGGVSLETLANGSRRAVWKSVWVEL
jgi:hypothetical protein